MDGILYFISDVDESPKLRLYLPEHLVDGIIKEYHEFSHLGIKNTTNSHI